MSPDRERIAEACAKHLAQVGSCDLRELANASGARISAALVAVVLAGDGRFRREVGADLTVYSLAPRPPRHSATPEAPRPPPTVSKPVRPLPDAPPVPVLVRWLMDHPGEWTLFQIAAMRGTTSQNIDLQVKRWSTYINVRLEGIDRKVISLRTPHPAAPGHQEPPQKGNSHE